jgi:hypothetical protein
MVRAYHEEQFGPVVPILTLWYQEPLNDTNLIMDKQVSLSEKILEH